MVENVLEIRVGRLGVAGVPADPEQAFRGGQFFQPGLKMFLETVPQTLPVRGDVPVEVADARVIRAESHIADVRAAPNRLQDGQLVDDAHDGSLSLCHVARIMRPRPFSRDADGR